MLPKDVSSPDSVKYTHNVTFCFVLFFPRGSKKGQFLLNQAIFFQLAMNSIFNTFESNKMFMLSGVFNAMILLQTLYSSVLNNSIPGFLSLSTTDIMGKIILWRGGREGAVLCITGNLINQQKPPPLDNENFLQTSKLPRK